MNKKYLLLILLLYINLLTKSQTYSAMGYSLASKTAVLGMDSLRQKLTGVEIIGLGEVSHGSADLVKFKADLFKFSVEKLNFRVLLLEFDDPSLRQLNTYLQNGNGGVAKILDSLMDLTFNAEQGGMILNNADFRDLLSWLKNFNLLNPQDMVSIKGIDIFVPFSVFRKQYMDSSAVKLMQAEFGKRDLSVQESRRLINSWYAREKSNLKAKLSTGEFSLLEMDVRNFDGQMRYYIGEGAKSSAMVQLRDSLILLNVQEFRKQKSVVWAHNLHIGTSPFRIGKFRAKMLGQLLKQNYGAAYFSILTDYSGQAKVSVLSRSGKFTTNRFVNNNATLSSRFKNSSTSFPLLLFADELNLKQYSSTMNNIGLFGDYFLYQPDHFAFDAVVLFKDLGPHKFITN